MASGACVVTTSTDFLLVGENLINYILEVNCFVTLRLLLKHHYNISINCMLIVKCPFYLFACMQCRL